MEMGILALIILVGLLPCNVDAQLHKPYGDLKLDDRKDQREKHWNFGLTPSIYNGRPGLKANLGYQKNNFRAEANYQYQNTPSNDYHRVGGSIGYDNGKFSVKGTGFYDSTGNGGGGISFGYRWKRTSLRKPKGAFYLRVEADPCQFKLYDRNGDDVITIEELEEVFPDRNLADGLFQRLDVEERGEISRKEFEAAKASGAIVGCVVPAYEERIPDESDLME